jgi:hypothetical protein
MFRISRVLLAATAVAAVAAPAAGAAQAKPQRFTVRGTMHVVSATGVQANGDGRYVVEGPVTSTGLGQGAATYRSTIRDGKVTGTVVATFATGTIHTAMHGTLRLSSGRTTGHGRITRGTGAYRGVTGSFRFTGQSHADGTTAMVLEGRVRPPAGASARRIPIEASTTLQPVGVDDQGRYLVRGPVTSAGLGQGEAIYAATIAGTTVTAPVVARFAGGTILAQSSGTLTPSTRPGIVNEIAGTGRITGGTGIFARARGTYTFTGQSHDDGSIDLTLHGSVVNPDAPR